jgi:hypothetical protein
MQEQPAPLATVREGSGNLISNRFDHANAVAAHDDAGRRQIQRMLPIRWILSESGVSDQNLVRGASGQIAAVDLDRSVCLQYDAVHVSERDKERVASDIF